MRGLAKICQEDQEVVRVCVCGCGRSFPAGKHGRKYFDTRSGSACRKKVWESRWLRKRPSKGNTGLSVPFERLPKRVYSRQYVEVGSIRKALETVARLSPAFFLRLADDLRKTESTQVAAD
jgi:hypothetical protein